MIDGEKGNMGMGRRVCFEDSENQEYFYGHHFIGNEDNFLSHVYPVAFLEDIGKLVWESRGVSGYSLASFCSDGSGEGLLSFPHYRPLEGGGSKRVSLITGKDVSEVVSKLNAQKNSGFFANVLEEVDGILLTQQNL